MTIADPADFNDFRNMLFEAIKLHGPVYIRKHKQVIKKINPDNYEFKFGKSVLLKEGDDLAIIACGTMVYQSYWAADLLKQKGINAAVINMHTIKPLDEEMVEGFINKAGRIVTAEEHTIINGLGSAVSDVIAKKGKGIQLKIGFNDEWPTDGPYLEVLGWHGLTGPKIAENIEKWVKA
jgi:transketolase